MSRALVFGYWYADSSADEGRLEGGSNETSGPNRFESAQSNSAAFHFDESIRNSLVVCQVDFQYTHFRVVLTINTGVHVSPTPVTHHEHVATVFSSRRRRHPSIKPEQHRAGLRSWELCNILTPQLKSVFH